MAQPVAMRPALLALAALTACAYVDADPHWAARPAQFVEATVFATGRERRGIDPPAPADRVEKGDRILYGIEFDKGGARHDWLVAVEVVDPRFEPRQLRDGSTVCSLRLDVQVRDEAGTEVGRELVTVSRRDLVSGLFAACPGASRDPNGAPDASRYPDDSAATLALLNMLHVIRKSPVLFGILRRVIDTPPILSIVVNLGVSVSLRTDFAAARTLPPVAIDGQQFPVYELPVELLLNDRPALRSKLLVTRPRSPLNLSAGILGLDAFQPSDPDARVSIRVLAARRAR